jgi:hypothetical protein
VIVNKEDAMMNLKFRTTMIIRVIFGAVASTFTLAVFSELVLPAGYVHYVALGLFAGATIIGAGGLVWFLKIALVEWECHDEQTKDIFAVDRHELMFVRSEAKVRPLRELDEYQMKVVVIPAHRKRAMPLEDAQLDAALYHRLTNGGKSNAHEH